MRSEKTYVSEANQNAPWVLEGFLFSRERQDGPVSARWKPKISGAHGNQRGKLAKNSSMSYVFITTKQNETSSLVKSPIHYCSV